MYTIRAVATKKWEKCCLKLLGNFQYPEVILAGPWKMAEIWLKGKRKAWENFCLQIQWTCKGLLFSLSFCWSAVFQWKAFHVFLLLEHNWITSPLSGESCLVREPRGLLRSFCPLKEAVLICLLLMNLVLHNAQVEDPLRTRPWASFHLRMGEPHGI